MLKNPARIFVFIDSGNCDCCSFGICPFGYGYPEVSQWFNIPTERHGGGANLSFADGHAEHQRWRWPKSTAPVAGGLPAVEPDDAADLRWLQDLLPRE